MTVHTKSAGPVVACYGPSGTAAEYCSTRRFKVEEFQMIDKCVIAGNNKKENVTLNADQAVRQVEKNMRDIT
jgi:hypothetical protein